MVAAKHSNSSEERLQRIEKKLDSVVTAVCGPIDDPRNQGMAGVQQEHHLRLQELEEFHGKIKRGASVTVWGVLATFLGTVVTAITAPLPESWKSVITAILKAKTGQ